MFVKSTSFKQVCQLLLSLIVAMWQLSFPLSSFAGSDKPCNFSTWFKCSNHMCVPNYYRCDGKDDCGDKSDGMIKLYGFSPTMFLYKSIHYSPL